MQPKTSIYVLALTILSIESKVFRNDNIIALYQNGNRNSVESTEKQEKHEKILLTMQNVLCRNFPKVPCNLITQDETLRNLIKQSIAQMNFKTLSLEHKQKDPHIGIIDSEELSSYLTVKNTGYFMNEKENEPKKKKNKTTKKNNNGFINGRKIKKYYPRKYKEVKKEATKEKVDSMSEEFPQVASLPHIQNGPVWHMDYTKQGEPTFNKFKKSSHGYNGRRGKEVFIKKSFVRNDDD